MEKDKKGINAKLIVIIAAAVAVIVAAFFGIKALIPEKTPVNDKAESAKPEVITLPGEDKVDVTAITGTKADKKGITDKEGHKIYDTGFKNENGDKIYTTGKKDANGNILYTLNRTNDVGNLIYYTGKEKDGKLEITRTQAIPDYTTDKNSKLTRNNRYTTTKTVKYEADENEVTAKALSSNWISFLKGSEEDILYKIIPVDGGFVVCGSSDSTDGDFKNASDSWSDYFGVVSKISDDGKVEWTYTTGGNGLIMFNDVAQLKDGSIVAVGSTSATNTDAPKTGMGAASLIVKLDKNGKEVWSYAFPCNKEENGDIAYSVAATPDGGFVVGGEANSTTGLFKDSEGKYKAYIFKFDKSGNIDWKKTLYGSKDNQIKALAVNDKGEIFATCVTYSFDGNFKALDEYKINGSNPNTVVMKLSKKGDLIWSYNIAGWGRSEFDSVAVTPDGGCVVGGTMTIIKRANGSFSKCYGSSDGYIVRFTPDGEVYWAHNIGGTDADTVEEVIVTDKGIVVTGTTQSSNCDFAGLITTGKMDGYIMVLDNSGKMIFANLFGGAEDDKLLSVAPSENGIALCGFTTSSDGVFKGSDANKKAQAFVKSFSFDDGEKDK